MYNQKLLKIANYVDKIIKLFLKANKTKKVELNKLQAKKILLLESHLIGDIIMTLPLLSAIKSKYPNAKIHFLGNRWAEEILIGNSCVSKIITVKIPWAIYDYSLKTIWDLFKNVLKLRKENYDIAIDSRGDMRNNFLLYCIGAERRLGFGITGGEYFLTDIAPPPPIGIHLIEHRFKVLIPLGIEDGIISPQLKLSDERKVSAKEIAEIIGVINSTTVAIHPGASRSEKRWGVNKHGDLIKRLKKNGVQIVLIGGPEDGHLLKEIVDASGINVPIIQPTITKFIDLLSYVKILIAMDSAAAHIGAAVGCITVVIFGPVNPRLSRPWGKMVRVIAPENPPYQMDAVDVNTVYSVIMEILNEINT
jgi:ADP-heptose:LPS heptosyltransferase